MATKNKSNKSFFVGDYIDDMALLLTATSVSWVHALAIGSPGNGKTAVFKSGLRQIYGDKFNFLRFASSTPPEVVRGMYDPAAMLSSPPKLVHILNGTLFDPHVSSVMLDEMFRPSDPVFDICLDGLDRQDIDPDDAPVILGTTNFLSHSDRTAALRDRITLYYWMPNETVNTRLLVTAQLTALKQSRRLYVKQTLPTIDQIENVKNSTPGPKAIKAVANIIGMLEAEAVTGILDPKDESKTLMTFTPNNRRKTQWATVLYRTSVYFNNGDENFDTVHPKALETLKWAMPTMSEQESIWWAQICSAIADPVDTAIQKALSNAYAMFEEVRDERKNKGGNRADMALKLATALSNTQNTLMALGSDDDRVVGAIEALTLAFQRAVQDKDPLGDD